MSAKIEYLNHIFNYSESHYTYLNLYICEKCNVKAALSKAIMSENEFMILPKLEYLELTCEEYIIKGIIE